MTRPRPGRGGATPPESGIRPAASWSELSGDGGLTGIARIDRDVVIARGRSGKSSRPVGRVLEAHRSRRAGVVGLEDSTHPTGSGNGASRIARSLARDV